MDPSAIEDKWVFGVATKDGHSIMLKHRRVKISRHSLVPNGYLLDDPNLKDFWEKRKLIGTNSNLVVSDSFINKIVLKQRHTCPLCAELLYNGELIENHHIIPKSRGGQDTSSNFMFLYKVCHQKVSMTNWIEYAALIKSSISEIKSIKV